METVKCYACYGYLLEVVSTPIFASGVGVLYDLVQPRRRAIASQQTFTVAHITLSKKIASKPSLEFYSDGSREARRVAIENIPFRIGRAPTADLRVDAVEVSREHAEIIERNGAWLVRDLGSTNGTHLNGKAITEALLNDGDILKVAETEFTFVASATSQFQRMVTQPILAKKKSSSVGALPPEALMMRMLTEATLWQAIPNDLLACKSLRQGDTRAFFAPPHSMAQGRLFEYPHPIGERFGELARMMAIDQALRCTDAGILFLAVGPADIASPNRLFCNLNDLKLLMPNDWDLGITISLPIDVDILRIGDMCCEARENGLLIAFDEFQGNGGQVMHLRSAVPDYLVLAPSMTKDLTSTRQPRRRLESLLAACEELAIKPVLPRNCTEHSEAFCLEIGFDLVLRSLHGVAEVRSAEVIATV